jgi:hypothetical protein
MKYSYPGSKENYLNQALKSTGIIALACSAIYLVSLVFDRFIVEGNSIGVFQLFALAGLIVMWGFFSIRLALSLARFSIEVVDSGFLVRQPKGSAFIPFEEIGGVEIVGRPAWWAMRVDLKPLKQTARHMVRISRSSGPPVTFMGGLDDEEELVRMIEERITKD